MKTLIANTHEGFRLGEAITYRNLCVFPLFAGEDAPPVYMSLKKALEQQLVEITEVSESGSVPNLKVTNKADVPVILIDGEEMAGAKQNRIVNTSLLLAAKSETVIPVSCTEQGRWGYNSPSFRDSGYMMSSEARYRKSARVSMSLKMSAGYNANQSEVWEDVRHLHRTSGTSSHTGAMQDAYLQKESDIDGYLKAFPLQTMQKGLVVFLNGKLAGMDYLSRCDAYHDLHDKLLKSHIVEALHREVSLFDPTNLEIDANLFLKSLAETVSADEFKPVGLGTDVRLESDRAAGAALVYEEAVIHLTAFSRHGIDDTTDSQAASRSSWGLTNDMRRRRFSPFSS